MDKGREYMNFEQKNEDKKGRAYCRVFKFWRLDINFKRRTKVHPY